VRYLLDTNVVSALRVRGRNPSVEAWAASVPVADQYLAATAVAELERGVVAKERSDPAQGEVLRRWFDERVLPAFAGRVLPFDLPAARILATYRVPEHAPLDDALIAAIADAHDLTVATRNTRHFEPLGVGCLNPWDPSPEPRGDPPCPTWAQTRRLDRAPAAPHKGRPPPLRTQSRTQ
jgi:predicted nucleic acid-binding protein